MTTYPRDPVRQVIYVLMLFTLVSCSDGDGGTVAAITSSDPSPTATISADDTSIDAGAATSLSWSSSNADSCSGTNFDTGGATTGSVDVSPSSNTTYAIDCDGATDQVAVSVASATSVIVTLDPVLLDFGSREQAYEPSVEGEFSSSPSGELVVYDDSTQPPDVTKLIQDNMDWLLDQGLDTVYVFPVDGSGQLMVDSPTLLALTHEGHDYDSGDDEKKRYVLIEDMLDEIVAAAHNRDMQVVVNIESLAHIINRSRAQGIGGDEDTLSLADDLPAPTPEQTSEFVSELLAYGVDAVAAEAFPADQEDAVSQRLANAGVPYWRAGADQGDVWMAYHYSTYPVVREDTDAYQYLHTVDSLVSTTNGLVHGRARATGNDTWLTLGAYNPLPCDLTLNEADLYSEDREIFIDNEAPRLADGTPVDNCATDFWRNLALFVMLGQEPEGILIATDLTPSIAAGLDPNTVPALLSRLQAHPYSPPEKPVANIIIDRPDFDEAVDGLTPEDLVEMADLTVLPLVSDALDAAGFRTVLTRDDPWTGGQPELTYIITAGGNEGTFEGDMGSGPPKYARAMDLPDDLVALLDSNNHPGPVFLQPLLGIPMGMGSQMNTENHWSGWHQVRQQFGLPHRFQYENPQSSSFDAYHTSRVFSSLVDADGEVVVPPGQIYIVPQTGQVAAHDSLLEPWFDIMELGHFANYVQPGSEADNIDAARVTFEGPLRLPQAPGADPAFNQEIGPYMLDDDNGRYLWLINQLHQEAFVWLAANTAAEAAGLTPPLNAPAKAHINGGARFMALAYDETDVDFSMPLSNGDDVRVRIYDHLGESVTDETVQYTDHLTYSLAKRSLLVAEPAGD